MVRASAFRRAKLLRTFFHELVPASRGSTKEWHPVAWGALGFLRFEVTVRVNVPQSRSLVRLACI